MGYKLKNTEQVQITGAFNLKTGTEADNRVLTTDKDGNAAWADSSVGIAIGGATTEIQFNLDGVLTGGSNLTWNNTVSAFTVGTRIAGTVGTNSFSSGTNNLASATTSHVIGQYTNAIASGAFAGGIGILGKEIISSGSTSFNFSQNDATQTTTHGALANNSVILGGRNHNIDISATNAVALGGQEIKIPSTGAETVYVSNLAIWNAPTTDAANLNALVYDPVSKKVLQRSLATTAGETNTASNLGTGTGIFAQKNSTDLEFKSLIAGTAITLTNTVNDITIDGRDFIASSGINTSQLVLDIVELDISAYSTTGNISLETTGSLTTLDIKTAASGIITLETGTGVGSFSAVMDTTNGLIITDNRTISTGIQYAIDYSADYTARSLVDSQFVNTEISNALTALTIPADVTTSNGIVRVGNDIQLGTNPLTQNTNIDGDSNIYDFTFTGLNLFSVNSTGNISLSNTNVDITLGSSLTITDNRAIKEGLQYAAHYTYNDFSLVDKAYVDSAIVTSDNTPAGSNLIMFNTNGVLDSNADFKFNPASSSIEIGLNSAVAHGYRSLIVGSGEVSGSSAAAVGLNVFATNLGSFAHGQYTESSGGESFAGGKGFNTTNVRAAGAVSFNFSENTATQTAGNGALANNSAILGGQNHNIQSNATRTVILGGSSINATLSDTVYVSNLAINEAPLTSSTISESLVWDSVTKQIKRRTFSFSEQGLVGTKSVEEASIGDQKFLRYNSSTNKLEYVTLTTSSASTILYREERTGNGSTAVYTMVNTVSVLNYVEVNGLVQDLGDDFTISGNVITFTSNVPSGFNITVSYFETVGIVLPPTTGETNVGANAGVGTGVYRDKIGPILNFKSLIAGSSITLTDNGDDITIDATVPASNVYTAGSGISESGNQFSVSAGTGLVQLSSGLELSHLGLEALTGPSVDRILFWDQSALKTEWLTLGTNLTLTQTTLSATNTDTHITTEEVQDIAGAMTIGNTETDITVTYQDVDGTIDYAVNNVFVRKDTNTQNSSFASGSLVWTYATSTNVDHIRFDDTTNTYHLCADTTIGATGNANVNVGTLTASGEITAFSDFRIKKDIRPLEDSLNLIQQLQGVKYKLKEDISDNDKIGLIAQDVAEVIPEIVRIPESESSFYSIDYSKLTAVLVEAVKELKQENNSLKEEIKEIKEILKNIGY